MIRTCVLEVPAALGVGADDVPWHGPAVVDRKNRAGIGAFPQTDDIACRFSGFGHEAQPIDSRAFDEDPMAKPTAGELPATVSGPERQCREGDRQRYDREKERDQCNDPSAAPAR